MSLTITEALAEIKTTAKRIASKKNFINQYLYRLEGTKDPLEKDGGSAKIIDQELQAIQDLENNIVTLRRGIQTANEKTSLTIEGETMSIADWLIWRREVYPSKSVYYAQLRNALSQVREQAKRQGVSINAPQGQEKPNDVVVNINEKALAGLIETMDKIDGQLDGQLSLKNATVTI